MLSNAPRLRSHPLPIRMERSKIGPKWKSSGTCRIVFVFLALNAFLSQPLMLLLTIRTVHFGHVGDDQPAGAATDRGGLPCRFHRPSSRCRRTQHGSDCAVIRGQRRRASPAQCPRDWQAQHLRDWSLWWLASEQRGSAHTYLQEYGKSYYV